MTNFRALCEELLDELELWSSWHDATDLKDRAGSALHFATAEQPVAIGPEWQPCVKLPITVHVREQRPGETHTGTREGITPLRHDDLIMRGVQGEEYPIGRELFEQTYRMGTSELEGPTDEELLELTDYGISAESIGPLVQTIFARWGQS
jgi:hypothetical protein